MCVIYGGGMADLELSFAFYLVRFVENRLNEIVSFSQR